MKLHLLIINNYFPHQFNFLFKKFSFIIRKTDESERLFAILMIKFMILIQMIWRKGND